MSNKSKDPTKFKIIRRAMESVKEFNLLLNRQRPKAILDLQTEIVNYPVGLGRQNKTLTSTFKIGRYPVAVMPSQYQDWYIDYKPEELKYLPVNTVMSGPIIPFDKLPPVLTSPDISDSESSCCETCCSYDGSDMMETDQSEINLGEPPVLQPHHGE